MGNLIKTKISLIICPATVSNSTLASAVRATAASARNFAVPPTAVLAYEPPKGNGVVGATSMYSDWENKIFSGEIFRS